MRLIVVNHLTLDGVMQGPGRTDEDTRDDFPHGGWAAAGSDQALVDAVGERLGKPGTALLLGRRSYEDMLASWNAQGGPFGEALNAMPKFVASSSAGTELPWPNSTLLHGDVAAAVAELKGRQGGNLVIMGSGELIRSLLPHDLIDEWLLMVHPLALGRGRRLFAAVERPLRLALTEATTNARGVVIATYRPAGASRGA